MPSNQVIRAGGEKEPQEMQTPNVSIIMPAYNALRTVAGSIQSVLDQTYPHWELVVVDDGSTDDTNGIVRGFAGGDKRIVLLKLHQNGGLPNARNEGCRIAKGEYIAFLDSDDLWHKNKLERQLAFHTSHPHIEISHTDFHLFDEKGILRRPLKYLIDRKSHKEGQLYPRICYKNSIGVLTVMAKTSLLREVGFFDATLWTMEDQDLWVRIAKKGTAFGYLSDVLAYYRLAQGSITSRTGKYKRAYKRYILKTADTEKVDNRLLWRYYYRHFGTVYFKNGQYRLSRLYFCKSIQLVGFDFIAFSTLVYILYGMSKQVLRGPGLKK